MGQHGCGALLSHCVVIHIALETFVGLCSSCVKDSYVTFAYKKMQNHLHTKFLPLPCITEQLQ